MERRLMKEQRKLARAKHHDAKRAKSGRAKRSRPSARKARQEVKKLRDVARATRRAERKVEQEVPVEPEGEKSKDPFYNKKVRGILKKILKRASLKPVEGRKGSHSGRRPKSAGQSCGWRPGQNSAASEEPQVRDTKKVRTSIVTKWLKKAAKLSTENREGNVSEEKSPLVEEKKAEVTSSEYDSSEESDSSGNEEEVNCSSRANVFGELAPKESLKETNEGPSAKEFLSKETEQGSSAKEFLNNQVLLENIGPDLTSDAGMMSSESEVESGEHEDRSSAKQKQKRYKKRAAKNLRLWAESSDEEEDMKTERRGKSSARRERTARLELILVKIKRISMIK